jgi:hypothetical protein
MSYVPQLIVLGLVGAGIYAGYRWLMRASRELTHELERTDDELARRAAGGTIEKDLGALEYDPASGVYKPSKRV